MTLAEWFEQIYPLLINGVMDRVEKVLNDGTKIKAYRMGNNIRIDLTPVN
jgi:hypothetical protein